MSDLWAIVDGIHFEIECKTGSGVLSKHQKIWRRTVENLKCVFIEARETEQVIEEIKNALREKRAN